VHGASSAAAAMKINGAAKRGIAHNQRYQNMAAASSGGMAWRRNNHSSENQAAWRRQSCEAASIIAFKRAIIVNVFMRISQTWRKRQRRSSARQQRESSMAAYQAK